MQKSRATCCTGSTAGRKRTKYWLSPMVTLTSATCLEAASARTACTRASTRGCWQPGSDCSVRGWMPRAAWLRMQKSRETCKMEASVGCTSNCTCWLAMVSTVWMAAGAAGTAAALGAGGCWASRLLMAAARMYSTTGFWQPGSDCSVKGSMPRAARLRMQKSRDTARIDSAVGWKRKSYLFWPMSSWIATTSWAAGSLARAACTYCWMWLATGCWQAGSEASVRGTIPRLSALLMQNSRVTAASGVDARKRILYCLPLEFMGTSITCCE
mmetsp:Transcript_24336/g.41244  ORF Transcript_24336/g.41244 Transcript_24336/m.41244 type:complete len:270 (-) Transcript_24336:105-914(-)